MPRRTGMRVFESLPPFDERSRTLNAIIDTTKGSRNKYKWDERRGLFRLSGVLTAGASFPYDFGYVPGTEGEDGDALDVLVLMDEPAFVGCLVPARLIGVIEAEQTEDGRTERNDRLIAVADDSHTHEHVRSLSDMSDVLLGEIEHFFVSYNEARGKRFAPLGRAGPARAAALVRQGTKGARKAGAKKGTTKRPAKKRAAKKRAARSR